MHRAPQVQFFPVYDALNHMSPRTGNVPAQSTRRDPICHGRDVRGPAACADVGMILHAEARPPHHPRPRFSRDLHQFEMSRHMAPERARSRSSLVHKPRRCTRVVSMKKGTTTYGGARDRAELAQILGFSVWMTCHGPKKSISPYVGGWTRTILPVPQSTNHCFPLLMM